MSSTTPNGSSSKPKKKNRRGQKGKTAWKPYYRMNVEERHALQLKKERKDIQNRDKVEVINIPLDEHGNVKEGTNLYDYMPAAPRSTTQSIIDNKLRFGEHDEEPEKMEYQESGDSGYWIDTSQSFLAPFDPETDTKDDFWDDAEDQQSCPSRENTVLSSKTNRKKRGKMHDDFDGDKAATPLVPYSEEVGPNPSVPTDVQMPPASCQTASHPAQKVFPKCVCGASAENVRLLERNKHLEEELLALRQRLSKYEPAD